MSADVKTNTSEEKSTTASPASVQVAHHTCCGVCKTLANDVSPAKRNEKAAAAVDWFEWAAVEENRTRVLKYAVIVLSSVLLGIFIALLLTTTPTTAKKPITKEALRCIAMPFDAGTGERQCINWDWKQEKVFGLRRVEPASITWASRYDESFALYVDGAGNYAVLTSIDFERVEVIAPSENDHYSLSVRVGDDYRVSFSERLHPYIGKLLVFNTAGIRAPSSPVSMPTGECDARMDWKHCLLLRAISAGVVDVSELRLTCENQVVNIGPFELLPNEKALKMSSSKIAVNATIVQMLTSIGDAPAHSAFFVTDVSITISVARTAIGEETGQRFFHLIVILPRAKYCGRVPY